jgi:hypothetical protein
VKRAVDAAGAVDAQTAPTAPWKSRRDFHKRPPPVIAGFDEDDEEEDEDERSHLRANPESDDTHDPYGVAAFQAFLSGRL